MKDSKLITVLSGFNERELERLGHFLSSPAFYNSNARGEQIQSLFAALRHFHPHFAPDEIDKEKIYSIVYGSDQIKAGRIEKLMTMLFQRIEDFIFIEHKLEQNQQFERQQSLIEFYGSRKLDQLQTNALRKQVKDRQKLIIKNKQDFYQDYLTQSMLTSNESLANNRHSDLNLPSTIESLDIYYLTARLEYTCNLLAQERFHNIIDPRETYYVLELLKPALELDKFASVPQIKVYTAVYQILASDQKDVDVNLKNIKHLEGLLVSYKEVLPEILVISLHGFNRSLVMRILNLGKTEYIEAAFELYQSHLKSKVIFINGTLHQGNYKNIASIGIMLEKYDWVLDFLKQYKSKVNGKDNIEDIYHFNLANCYFHQNKIQEAHEVLPQHFEDLYYRLAGKRLEIKILYKQGVDLLDFKIKAFNQYIYRISNTVLPEVARLGNKNFSKILLRILAPNNSSQAKRQKIKERILKMKSIKEKDWLLDILANYRLS